jgi:hypothetical protein
LHLFYYVLVFPVPLCASELVVARRFSLHSRSSFPARPFFPLVPLFAVTGFFGGVSFFFCCLVAQCVKSVLSHFFPHPFSFPNFLPLLQQDCSLRVCPVGKAFVDTPAGDLNHDGKVGAGASDYAIQQTNKRGYKGYESWPNTAAEGGWAAQIGESHFLVECSGKGSCNRGLGVCQCFDGYSGASCQRSALNPLFSPAPPPPFCFLYKPSALLSLTHTLFPPPPPPLPSLPLPSPPSHLPQ